MFSGHLSCIHLSVVSPLNFNQSVSIRLLWHDKMQANKIRINMIRKEVAKRVKIHLG